MGKKARVTKNTEKTVVLNAFFASVFTNQDSLKQSLDAESLAHQLSVVEKYHIRKHKQTGYTQIHSKCDGPEYLGSQLMLLWSRSWLSLTSYGQMGVVLWKWKKVNITSAFKKEQ